MPVYTVYHRSPFGRTYKREIALALTNLHSTVTGAPAQAVKVIFIPLDEFDFFSGGQTKNHYVRVVAQIRKGRSEEQRMSILSGMFEIVQRALQLNSIHRDKHGPEGEPEIQTQIIEIDDNNTVMTNGTLNN